MEKVDVNRDFESMLISAERYACGRRSYIVSDCVNYITAMLPKLSDWCVRVLAFDLKSSFEQADRAHKPEYLGDKCDQDAWKRMLAILTDEIERRNAL